MFFISQARVISHNPPNGLQVIFKSVGQSPSFPVTVLRDYADARRVSQRPLPQIGTWGLVVFPYGDIRNGVWIGSYYPSQMDALTTTLASGHAPSDPFIDYEASFSGDWWLMDGIGNRAHQYADSSYFVASGSSGIAFPSLPTLYRHVVDATQKQNTIAYPYSDRVTNPPVSGRPFFYGFKHHSGTLVSMDSSGSTVVSGASGATFKDTFGGTVFTIDVSGNTTVSGSPKANLVFNFGNTTLTVDSSGNITFALAGGDLFNITQGGASPSDGLVLVSKLIAAYNAHVHTDPQGGNTGVPTVALTASGVRSTIIDISN